MSRKKDLAKNTAILSIGTFLPKAVTFVTLPIVTAGLTKTEYGTYDLITTLVSFFLPMFTLQIQAAAFRFLIDARGNEKDTRRVITNVFAFIVPVSVLSLIVLFFVLSDVPAVTRLLICIYFFLDVLVLSARQVVRGLDNNTLYSVSAVAESLMNMVLIFTTVKGMRGGLTAVLFSLSTATMGGLLIILVKGSLISRIEITLFDKAFLKGMLHYSLPLVPHVMSDWILRLSDRMIITAFMGLEATAVYAVANKIPAALTMVQNTFTYAWQENASLASRDEDEDAYYTQVFEIVSRILSGATALLIASTPILFRILIKGEYQEAYQQMPILFLGMFFSAFSAFLGGIYVAHKKTKSMALTTMAAAGINLALDSLLIGNIGIYAASVSTLGSYVFLTVYRMIDIRKSHQIEYRFMVLALHITILIGMCLLCWFNTLFSNLINAGVALVFAGAINRKLVVLILKKYLRDKMSRPWRNE